MCLDSDDAGNAAVERICSNGMLASVSSQNVAEIRVATLPDDTKDPAEFIEQRKHSKNVAEDFLSIVVDTSVEWTNWYLRRMMVQYDSSAVRGSTGSFEDIFERVANFLGTFSNAAERTHRACHVAGKLADIISIGGSGVEVSHTARIQLESDLVARVSQIARSKEAITKRIESLEGGTQADIGAKLSNLALGFGLSGSDESEKLSSKALYALSQKAPNRKKPSWSRKSTKPSSEAHTKSMDNYNGRRGYKPPQQTIEKDIIPHHQGFRFQHPTDAEWLTSDENGVSYFFLCLPTRM